MKREVTLEEISDGRLYGSNDMVKADCGDCNGCSACCRGMGASITLDPLDIYRLTTNLELSFDGLLAEHIELNVSDGIILPNLKMAGSEERCTFLNTQGRCSIHPHRPGICRLFPLGRFYENGSFQYFLQTHECKNENRTKVKVKKWIDTPNLKQYEKFTNDWHYFLLKMQERAEGEDEQMAKQVSMFLLQTFYIRPYDRSKEFYPQFEERMEQAKLIFHL
ncbi:MAG: YkgJ family cysteine cluster protein [Lachnospiraceae bacterium]